MIAFRQITQDEAKAIREQVLRPTYPLDWHHDSFHIGAFDGPTLVGICSIYHENPQEQLQKKAWRIRSIATLPAYRKQGLGRRLMEKCIEYAKSKGGLFVWSNAHTSAAPFYEKCGFTLQGSKDLVGAPFFYKKMI